MKTLTKPDKAIALAMKIASAKESLLQAHVSISNVEEILGQIETDFKAFLKESNYGKT